LTWPEIVQATIVGCMRQIDSLKKKSKQGNNRKDKDNWTPHIEGAAGELAVAKYCKGYWPGTVGNPEAPDVCINGQWYEVKTNTSRRWTDLIAMEKDTDVYSYIGVLSYLPDFYITGWLPAKDVKDKKWWREGDPDRWAHFVRAGALKPIDDLLKQEPA
jgi:hypothetical protein